MTTQTTAAMAAAAGESEFGSDAESLAEFSVSTDSECHNRIPSELLDSITRQDAMIAELMRRCQRLEEDSALKPGMEREGKSAICEQMAFEGAPSSCGRCQPCLHIAEASKLRREMEEADAQAEGLRAKLQGELIALASSRGTHCTEDVKQTTHLCNQLRSDLDELKSMVAEAIAMKGQESEHPQPDMHGTLGNTTNARLGAPGRAAALGSATPFRPARFIPGGMASRAAAPGANSKEQGARGAVPQSTKASTGSRAHEAGSRKIPASAAGRPGGSCHIPLPGPNSSSRRSAGSCSIPVPKPSGCFETEASPPMVRRSKVSPAAGVSAGTTSPRGSTPQRGGPSKFRRPGSSSSTGPPKVAFGRGRVSDCVGSTAANRGVSIGGGGGCAAASNGSSSARGVGTPRMTGRSMSPPKSTRNAQDSMAQRVAAATSPRLGDSPPRGVQRPSSRGFHSSSPGVKGTEPQPASGATTPRRPGTQGASNAACAASHSQPSLCSPHKRYGGPAVPVQTRPNMDSIPQQLGPTPPRSPQMAGRSATPSIPSEAPSRATTDLTSQSCAHSPSSPRTPQVAGTFATPTVPVEATQACCFSRDTSRGRLSPNFGGGWPGTNLTDGSASPRTAMGAAPGLNSWTAPVASPLTSTPLMRLPSAPSPAIGLRVVPPSSSSHEFYCSTPRAPPPSVSPRPSNDGWTAASPTVVVVSPPCRLTASRTPPAHTPTRLTQAHVQVGPSTPRCGAGHRPRAGLL